MNKKIVKSFLLCLLIVFSLVGFIQNTKAQGRSFSLLDRTDFLLVGACPVCCRILQYKFDHTPGVLEANVSMAGQHWVMIIYDRNKCSLQQLMEKVREQKVSAINLSITPILTLPLVRYRAEATQ